DVLRAQVETARMVEDTLRMRAMRESMTGRLAALVEPSSELLSGSPVLPAFPASEPPLDSLAGAAERGRAMIAAGERDLHAAEQAVRLARREIWPDLELGVQVGRRSGAMGPETMGSLMIGASVPIFARSRQLKMREEAAAMRDMAASDLAAMRAQTRGRVVEIYAQLMRARRLAVLYRTTVLPQAEATVESALSAYRVGSVDFMTLLENRMTVNRFHLELIVLESEEGMAWAELEMLLGRQLLDPASQSTQEPAQ
ncbi:MAG: TolC family protein, partial [Gemmatimonadaceae bacterium]